MRISTQVKQGFLVVKIEGEFDMHIAGEFRECCDNAFESTDVKNLLLNLRGVSFIDSSGLGVILGRYKQVSQMEGKMYVTNLQPQVERIFELSGLFKIMSSFRTETEALQHA